MPWTRRDLKDHSVPISLPWAGLWPTRRGCPGPHPTWSYYAGIGSHLTWKTKWVIWNSLRHTWTCVEPGTGLNDPCRSLPIQDILWFNYSTHGLLPTGSCLHWWRGFFSILFRICLVQCQRWCGILIIKNHKTMTCSSSPSWAGAGGCLLKLLIFPIYG